MNWWHLDIMWLLIKKIRLLVDRAGFQDILKAASLGRDAGSLTCCAHIFVWRGVYGVRGSQGVLVQFPTRRPVFHNIDVNGAGFSSWRDFPHFLSP